MSTATLPVESAIQTASGVGRRRWMLSVLALVVIVGTLFVLQLRHFSPYMTDDAYISLRYSQRLLEGRGLTWNDLRPVEGYTNLLWVLLCAGLGALHIPLPLAAHLLGTVTSALILVAVAWHVYRVYPRPLRFLAALAGCGALVLSSTFSMWALGGLEQPLLACLLAWAALLMLPWLEAERPSTRTALAIGSLLGLAAITRADGALFTAAFYLAAVICDGLSRKALLSRARILPLPILFTAGQVCFRRLYYRDWLPNTAYVKVAFTLHRLRTGLSYVGLAARINLVFLALALVASHALLRAGRRKPVVFAWTVALPWIGYLILIGGDIFPAARHFEPLIALFGFVLPGCALLAADDRRRIQPPLAAALLAAVGLVATSDRMTPRETWEQQGESLGLFLRQAFGQQHPLLCSDAAGVVPYFAHMAVLDPLGLNDYHIAHEVSQERGYGWVGHELGDGAYILDQKPDFLLLSSFDGSGALFPADLQVLRDSRFPLYYRPVRFDTPGPHSVRAWVYVRRIDGHVGIVATPDRIVIPGYLATVDAANSARLVDGKAALVVAAHHDAEFADLPVASGEWSIAVDADAASTIVLAGVRNAERSAECGLCLRVRNTGPVTVALGNRAGAPAVVRSLTLTRR